MANVEVRFNKSNRWDDKTKKIKSEIRRKASMANKRLERLERNDLTQLPAYRQWVNEGSKRFTSAGSDYNQLQAELARIDRFLNSKTSLVREANRYLKDVARITGVKYDRVGDLVPKLSGFFEVASKIEQYLRQVEQAGSALSYHEIWDKINTYVQQEEMDLKNVEKAVQDLIPDIIQGQLWEQVQDMWDSIV